MIVYPQRTSTSTKRGIGELDINTAIRNYNTFCRIILIVVPAYQAGCCRNLYNSRAVKLRYVKVAQRGCSYINSISDKPCASRVGGEHPRHVVRPCRNRRGNLHEHTYNSDRPIDKEDITQSPPVQCEISLNPPPVVHTLFIPSSSVFSFYNSHFATSLVVFSVNKKGMENWSGGR